MSTTTQRRPQRSPIAQRPVRLWYHEFIQAATSRSTGRPAARISIGFVFLWAFLDKNFGLQFATPKGPRLDRSPPATAAPPSDS